MNVLLLGLRNTNGSFILNENWKYGNTRTISEAGTIFTYTRQDASTLETITAPGPVANPVDIMVSLLFCTLLVVNNYKFIHTSISFVCIQIDYHQPNYGIKYSYSIPVPTNGIEQIAPPYSKHPNVYPLKLDSSKQFDISTVQRDEAKPTHHHRRRVRRRFLWRISGVSPCSKSCGGGKIKYLSHK